MSRILKIASYLPDEKITNEKLSISFKNWSADKIYEKTGIKKRSKSKQNLFIAEFKLRVLTNLFY